MAHGLRKSVPAMPRPLKDFNGFFGQSKVIAFLRRHIAGAKVCVQSCPSLLFVGPSGTGKSSLARAVATEYGSELHPILAGKEIRPVEICHTLLNEVKSGDVLFIDEIHALVGESQEILYVAIDMRKVPDPGGGRLDRMKKLVNIGDFTLIGATNQPGSLKRALLSRLKVIELDPYSNAELKAIAERIAEEEGFVLTPQAARKLAETAQGTPRRVDSRVRDLKTFFPGIQRFTQEHVEELLVAERIDEHGLVPYQRQYLSALANSTRGSSTLERLCVKLGCDPAYIRKEIEPYLVDRGFVDLQTARGRTITPEGQALAAMFEDDGAGTPVVGESLQETV